jgi:hypothetical protein
VEVEKSETRKLTAHIECDCEVCLSTFVCCVVVVCVNTLWDERADE